MEFDEQLRRWIVYLECSEIRQILTNLTCEELQTLCKLLPMTQDRFDCIIEKYMELDVEEAFHALLMCYPEYIDGYLENSEPD